MIQFVDCVYRVAEKGEMIQGQFDVFKGIICNNEKLLQFDITKDYEYSIDNYSYYSELPMAKLYNVLCDNPKALAVINYNNIGAVVVFRDKHSLYMYKSRQFIKHTAFMEEPFNLKTELIGIVRTPLKTYETLQPVFYLIVDKTDGTPIVHTSHGKKIVTFEYDKIDKPNLSRFVEMCKTEGIYASFEQDGKVKFAVVDGDELKILGGES